MIPLVPAFIPNSATEARAILTALSFTNEVHLDVVDGEFVPFVSWPLAPQGDPGEVKALTDRFTLEVDLMVSDPIPLAERFVASGADIIVFHVETISPSALKRFADNNPVSVVVSLHNQTDLKILSEYRAFTDGVQLMGIAQIGSQGQPFDARVLERIVQIKHQYPDWLVSVDGSVKRETIPSLVEAGAERLICGSAIVKAPDPEKAYRSLLELIN